MAVLSTYPDRTLVKVAGIDASGNVGLQASSTVINFGTATNASPQNGDLWFDGTNLKFHHGGVTTNIV